MKKNILLSALISLACAGVAKAQETDGVKPLLQFNTKNNEAQFTIGGRVMVDGAYIKSEYTPLKSGVALTDARIRTSMTWNQWYFFADFDFSGGNFKQKNLFGRYTFKNDLKGTQNIQFGYFAEPGSMSQNTSRFNYHFISRPSSVMALAQGRSLGIAYKFYNDKFFLHQGIFAENQYNDQLKGFQGFAASGRWLYLPVNNAAHTLHLGVSARYARINTGDVVNGVFKTSDHVGSTLETYVDPTTEFLNANVEWAKDVVNLGVEALYRSDRFFVRGEYMIKRFYKERPDQILFENQLGANDSWTTLASWQGGNPIRTTKFDGGYIETGIMLRGDKYAYDSAYGMLKGNKAKGALELVARYNYTNLNDITKGDVFLEGNGKFYPNGAIVDYPVKSTSIGGGRVHSGTIGLNYTINQYMAVMADYTYSNLDNVWFPMDKNFNTVQARVMFSF